MSTLNTLSTVWVFLVHVTFSNVVAVSGRFLIYNCMPCRISKCTRLPLVEHIPTVRRGNASRPSTTTTGFAFMRAAAAGVRTFNTVSNVVVRLIKTCLEYPSS